MRFGNLEVDDRFIQEASELRMWKHVPDLAADDPPEGMAVIREVVDDFDGDDGQWSEKLLVSTPHYLLRAKKLMVRQILNGIMCLRWFEDGQFTLIWEGWTLNDFPADSGNTGYPKELVYRMRIQRIKEEALS